MLLHRYFGSHTYETLEEAKLKTSRITSFNDPFEFLFVTKGKVTAKNAREYVLSRLDNPSFWQLASQYIPGLLKAKDPSKVLKRHIPKLVANLVSKSEEITRMPFRLREEMADRSTRVVCFSTSEIKPLDEILLWSHYARMHEGVRVGFEFPPEIKYPFRIFKLHYADKRFEIDFSKTLSNMTIGQALVECTKVKSSAWSYENEYRLLTHPDCCEQREIENSKRECFLAFQREWVRSIDFGVRCPQTEVTRIRELLKTGYPQVVCRKAEFHETEYALEYKNI